MDFLGPVRTFDRFQQRRKWLAVPIAVFKKFGNDQGGNLAALVAYYAFFSIFPLLLVMTTILGFALGGNSSAQQSVDNSLVAQLPIIGQQIKAHALTGSVIALILGLVTSLWAGLGVTSAAQNALDKVWTVPFKDRPNFLSARLRGLAMLVCLGILFLISTAASGLVSGGFGGIGSKVVGYALSLIANIILFLVAFRFMTASIVTTRDLRVGAIVAAVLWTILQSVGGAYIDHVVAANKNTYGTFAFVIALLVWLHLGAQMTLYAAEINVVLARKLYPRSLFGPPEAAADRETLT
ncbi:MAG TPA: YihY/virulence factor BrkB family protein, partial [Solirubrobacteraceae bacterium]|nr:YihY/virulence factor BrkB family protein [Solirubrobacteraceae bacterium]